MTENLPGHRRKLKLSARAAWKLCCEFNINQRVVLKDIAKSLDIIDISVITHTIQRCLNINGLYGNWPWWTPLHKPCHIVARFNFAKKFLDKGNCFWEQVRWNDERKIELFRHNDVQKIWHKKGEAFLPKNTVPTLKLGSSSMMFWGCFSSRETGQLIAIRGIMKSEDYIKILDENLQRSVQILDLCQQFTFQQDNDPKHMSESVSAWLQKNKITVLLSSSLSPHSFTHIENLWQELKVQINRWSLKNLQELVSVTIEEWKKIPEKNFRKQLQ